MKLFTVVTNRIVTKEQIMIWNDQKYKVSENCPEQRRIEIDQELVEEFEEAFKKWIEVQRKLKDILNNS